MHTYPTNKPLVVLTMGDPSGIGPEIIAGALLKDDIVDLSTFLIVGDEGVLSSYFPKGYLDSKKNIFMDDPGEPLMNMGEWKHSSAAQHKTLKSLDLAIDIAKKHKDPNKVAIVTAPVNKAELANISHGFKGHTEYLQEAFGVDFVSMSFVGDHLKTVPVTRHIPLSKVADVLDVEIILKTILQVAENRSKLSEPEALIGVCGLNPHCGEGGRMGNEEELLITPAIEKAKKVYPNITGPLPADVAFYKALKGELDIVIAMYHDQALGPFKMLDFDTGVNMTLGLPCTRTSPDHGTAYDIAGKGIANSNSLINAIKLAVKCIT